MKPSSSTAAPKSNGASSIPNKDADQLDDQPRQTEKTAADAIVDDGLYDYEGDVADPYGDHFGGDDDATAEAGDGNVNYGYDDEEEECLADYD